MSDITVSGVDSNTVESQLERMLLATRPKVLGLATAFLSVGGALAIDGLVSKCGATTTRVVAGLSGAVTHPDAIRYLAGKGHAVRLGTHSPGIFHPKLLVGGGGFLNSRGLVSATCCYVGSANFTTSGLRTNLEVAFATMDPQIAHDVATAFSRVWDRSERATESVLARYERLFAARQRRRSLEDLELLDVLDAPAKAKASKAAPLIPPRYCDAVWVGLQSFTGEHTFQVEFPKKAGEALGSLLGTREGRLAVECADGETREMTFRYYQDNGMYRLNVPNDVPLVRWARENKAGALLVWSDTEAGRRELRAEIVRGRTLRETVTRSKTLNSWGRTSTREFGWF